MMAVCSPPQVLVEGWKWALMLTILGPIYRLVSSFSSVLMRAILEPIYKLDSFGSGEWVEEPLWFES